MMTRGDPRPTSLFLDVARGVCAPTRERKHGTRRQASILNARRVTRDAILSKSRVIGVARARARPAGGAAANARADDAGVGRTAIEDARGWDFIVSARLRS